MTRRSWVDRDRILIAGGGIGGLAAALALAQKGIASLVLEKASQLGEIGAGIQLGPNAFHCFDRLGVGEAARGMAVYIDTLRLMDAMADGEITHIDLGETFRARFGNPYAVVHRGDLHGVLLKACRDHALIELRTSADVDGLRPGRHGVAARLADGETVRGAALIGADGLWSNVRRQVTGDGAAARLGPHDLPLGDPDRADARGSALERRHPVGRPEVPHRPLSAVGLEGVQPRRHLPQRCARAGRRQAGAGRGSAQGLRPCLRARAEHHPPWQGLAHVGAVRPRSGRRWVDGRVALLGDAAHPMLQYMAQGACMAMEDAVCLADSLGRTDTLEAGLATYRDRRVLRTTRLQLMSRAMGDHVYHPAGPHAALRNAIMSAKSQDHWLDTLEWLYGGNGLD